MNNNRPQQQVDANKIIQKLQAKIGELSTFNAILETQLEEHLNAADSDDGGGDLATVTEIDE